MPQGKLKIVAANARTDAPSNVNASAIAAANRGAIDEANKALLKSVFTSLTKNMNVVLSFLIKEYGVGSCFKVRCIDIHYATGVSVDTVQRILTKFAYEGFLSKKRIRDGRFQGLEVTLKPVCNHYQNFILNEVSAAPATATGFQPSIVSSINKSTYSEEALKILAVTDEDIAAQYPLLADAGFGSSQLSQIVEHREKLNLPLAGLLASLEYAEYMIKTKQPDKYGDIVSSYNGYFFNALKVSGAILRPDGYKTITERAVEEAKAVKKQELDAQYELWLLKLPVEDKEEILKGKSGPDDAYLRYHWKKNVLSKQGGSNG
ncbi:hypothetical protein [Maridesulfovibrio sp.]|uniref:hypothetical protein n=1 Tax=Maridesulfovibrio sp. TaxID=2795000 RepID=UPI002A18CE8F|nr:hypothetical protein [Maridesulfovibrio sp.]